jgi:hypothetical protein
MRPAMMSPSRWQSPSLPKVGEQAGVVVERCSQDKGRDNVEQGAAGESCKSEGDLDCR